MNNSEVKRDASFVQVDPRVIEVLRPWIHEAAQWAGEVTLVFPGSGGQISLVREERRVLCCGESALTRILASPWGDLQYGSRKVTYQGGVCHMVIECRTTKIL